VLRASEEASHRRPVRCAIYTRQSVSSSDNLSSCEVQYEACARYAESQGWAVVTERFDDDGYSGASLDRPALQRLLDLLRKIPLQHVLVHRLDRLSRSVRDCVTLLDEFRRLNVNLVIVTAPELGPTAQDQFILNILASFAEFEREMISARIAESRARLKARQLRFAGGVPFGYDSDPRTKQLVPNAVESDVVRWMFAEAGAGRRPSEIAEEANFRGYRTRSFARSKSGGLWTARQVLATLRNPTHIGLLKDGSRGVRQGTHPPIVDVDLFHTVATMLDARRTRRPKVSHYGAMWPLKGRILCGICGRPLTPHSTRRGNKVYRYYRCRATAGGRDPCGYQVSAGIIESVVAYQLPKRSRDELDSRRIRDYVELVIFEPESGTVHIRCSALKEPRDSPVNAP
jgi:site-specific DNA recombinase